VGVVVVDREIDKVDHKVRESVENDENDKR